MRMIDADALAKAMGVHTYMEPGWTPVTVWGVPIVEAEPVRHGKWNVWYHGDDNFSYSCNVCGIGSSLVKTRFCSYCGAKMDVEDHE